VANLLKKYRAPLATTTTCIAHQVRPRAYTITAASQSHSTVCGEVWPIGAPTSALLRPRSSPKQKHQIGSSTLHPGPPPEPPPWMTDTDVVRTSLRPAARLPLYLWLEARSARRSCNQILVRELQKRLEYRLSKLD
jgi:hypothetical protein